MFKMKETLTDILIMTFATLIIAFSVYFFLLPSHASVSSISGLAIVLINFIPLPLSTITMTLNVILLILGFLTIGRDFGYKTVYTSLLLPVFLALFEKIYPMSSSLTGSDALDVVSYIFFVSIGLALLFNRNASSGGLDIVAKIINRYLHIDIGHAMSISGMVVALSSAFAFPIRTVILSVLGTYLNGIVIDHFIFGQNIKRRVCIVSLCHMEEIRDYILNTLHSGATIYEAEGAYTGDIHKEIITIVDKHEYQKLMDFIIHCDSSAFVTVYNVSSMRYLPKKWK